MESPRRPGALIGLFLAAAACNPGKDPSGPARDQATLQSILVGDAAAYLGADGKFILAPPPSDDRVTVDAEDASRYAELAARQYGRLIAGDLQAQHGGPIDFTRLTACGAPLFARSPFTEIPESWSSSAAQFFGSFWIAAVCGPAGQRQVSVAIAASASGLHVDRGLLIVPPNAVKMVGIPSTWETSVPSSAEGAAMLAAMETGARVAAVPTLILPNPVQAFPQGAYWIVSLDRVLAIRGERSHQVTQTATILVGSAELPHNSMLRGPVGLYHELPQGRRSLPALDFGTRLTTLTDLPVRPGAVLDAEKILPIRGGQ